MTNALRKAPQHTAVGFKQTVSNNSHPFATCSSDNLVLLPYVGAKEGSLVFIIAEVASDACAQHCSGHIKQMPPAPLAVYVQSVLGRLV